MSSLKLLLLMDRKAKEVIKRYQKFRVLDRAKEKDV